MNDSASLPPNCSIPSLAPLTFPHVGALMVLSVGGVFGNVVMLVAVASTRALHTVRSVFTVFLAVSDLAVCLTAIPLLSHALPPGRLQRLPTRWACNVAGCTYVFFRWASLMAVSLISFDRCLAIRAPLRYTKILTAGRSTAIVSCTVLVTALLAVLPVAGVGSYEYDPGRGLCVPAYYCSLALTLTLLVEAACGPLALTLVAYGAVAEVALRTAKRGKVVCDETNCSYVVSRKAEIKPVQTLCTITGVYTMCWMPYVGINLWSFAWRHHPSQPVEALTECLLLFSSSINPAMYTLLDRSLRTAVSKLTNQVCQRCCHGATHTPQSARLATRTPDGATEPQITSD